MPCESIPMATRFYTLPPVKCRPPDRSGNLRVADDESIEVRYFHPDQLPPMEPVQRQKISEHHHWPSGPADSPEWKDEWLKNL